MSLTHLCWADSSSFRNQTCFIVEMPPPLIRSALCCFSPNSCFQFNSLYHKFSRLKVDLMVLQWSCHAVSLVCILNWSLCSSISAWFHFSAFCYFLYVLSLLHITALQLQSIPCQKTFTSSCLCAPHSSAHPLHRILFSRTECILWESRYPGNWHFWGNSCTGSYDKHF